MGGKDEVAAKLSRRSFVGFCAATAACAGVGAAARIAGGSEELLRPPGAQDEPTLQSSCLKCDRCRSICPAGIIGVAHIEDGILNARTPVLDFRKGYCDFCDLCLNVCPTGAIRPFDETKEKIGVAIVQKDRCLAYSNGCEECAQACPYEAITLDSAGYPVVDAAKCNGCGKCENVCPALVYRTFAGGSRRGIVVVPERMYERIGSTVSEGESEVRVP